MSFFSGFSNLFSKPQNSSNSGYRGETIRSAEYVTRPKQSPEAINVADHHGVRITTNEGNKYLVHSTPSSGVVVTDAKNMSNQWRVDHQIPVQGRITVGEAHTQASGRTTNSFANYVTGGTCIGAAQNAERAIRQAK